jgi:hypothetical protein
LRLLFFFFAQLPISLIEGRVKLVVWPPQHIGRVALQSHRERLTGCVCAFAVSSAVPSASHPLRIWLRLALLLGHSGCLARVTCF